MQTRRPVLIALYDAHHDGTHDARPELRAEARRLGVLIGKEGMGIVVRQGSPLVAESLFGLAGAHSAPAIILSPAASIREHEEAFGLAHLAAPTVYTGRGAVGADSMALHSAAAAVVFGAEPRALDHVLSQAEHVRCVIGILTDESAHELSERIHARRPSLAGRVVIAADPETLVSKIAAGLRSRSFSE